MALSVEENELITHVDEGASLALAPQFKREDAAIKGKRVLDVADLKRNVI